MEKVFLSIKGGQAGETEDDSVELHTQGALTKKKGALILEYEETEISGVEGTKTSITVEGNKVQLERNGEIHTHFMFEQGKRFEGNYKTPLGTMKMSVFPTLVNTEVTKNGGKVDLEYELSLGDSHSTNKLSLSYKKTDTKIN